MTSPGVRIRSVLQFLRSADPLTTIPLAFFSAVLLHGATIGPTDDEAYYWVLGGRPALGYAFHPPMIAWIMTFSRATLGTLFGEGSILTLRLPSALFAAWIFRMALQWLPAERRTLSTALIVLSFCGIFGMSWLLVPDLPLIAGWMWLFSATWKVTRRESETASRIPAWIPFFLSSALILLSKFSGVLALASSTLCLLLALREPGISKKTLLKSLAAMVAGAVTALIPILLWNSRHEWGAILYQISDRHSGAGLSLLRYLRFWATQIVFAGPVLIAFSSLFLTGGILRSSARSALWKFIAIWSAPAAVVFLVQPLFSDFKPHWAFIVWLPLLLAFARELPNLSARWKFPARLHVLWGGGLTLLVWLACHFPLVPLGWMMVKPNAPFNPLWDVTNDLYGWSDLRGRMSAELTSDELKLPILAVWYQTASQTAFAFAGERGSGERISLIPRDLKARDEWPDPGVTSDTGPNWPELRGPVLFVSDERYKSVPSFPNARCSTRLQIQFKRLEFNSKKIVVWKCVPGAQPR